jgi:hypothetical protein
MTTFLQNVGLAPFYMMITFEVAPEDERHFNDIYDNEHVPNILKVDGVLEVVRFRDALRNERGFWVYSALYFLARENLHETEEWKAFSEIGRWAPEIRPKLKSRSRRAGPVVTRFTKSLSE